MDQLILVLSCVVTVILFLSLIIVIIICSLYKRNKNHYVVTENKFDVQIRNNTTYYEKGNLDEPPPIENSKKVLCCFVVKNNTVPQSPNKTERLLIDAEHIITTENVISPATGNTSEIDSSRLSCIDRELPPIPMIPRDILEVSTTTSDNNENNQDINMKSSTEQLPTTTTATTTTTTTKNSPLVQNLQKSVSNNCICDPTKSISNDEISSLVDYDPTYAMINRIPFQKSATAADPNGLFNKPAIVIPQIGQDPSDIVFLLVCPSCGGTMTTIEQGGTDIDRGGSSRSNKRLLEDSWISLQNDVYNNMTTPNTPCRDNLIDKELLNNGVHTTTGGGNDQSNNNINDSTYASISKLPAESERKLPKITRQRSISQSDICNTVLIQNHLKKTKEGALNKNQLSKNYDGGDDYENEDEDVEMENDRKTILKTAIRSSRKKDLQDQQHPRSTVSIYSLRCSSCDSTTNIYRQTSSAVVNALTDCPSSVMVPDRKYGRSIVDMIEKLRKCSKSQEVKQHPSSMTSFNNRSFHDDSGDMKESRSKSVYLTSHFWSPPSCKMIHGEQLNSASIDDGVVTSPNSNFCSPLRIIHRSVHTSASFDSDSFVTGKRRACALLRRNSARKIRPSSVITPHSSTSQFLANNNLRKSSLFQPVLTPPPLSPLDGPPITMDSQLKSSQIECPLEAQDSSMDKSYYYTDLGGGEESCNNQETEVQSIITKVLDEPVDNSTSSQYEDAISTSDCEYAKIHNRTNRSRPISIDLSKVTSSSASSSVVPSIINKSKQQYPINGEINYKITSGDGNIYNINNLNTNNNNNNQKIALSAPRTGPPSPPGLPRPPTSASSSVVVSHEYGDNLVLSRLPSCFQKLMSSEDSCAKSPLSTEPSPLTEMLHAQNQFSNNNSKFNWSYSSSSTNINTAFIDEYETLE